MTVTEIEEHTDGSATVVFDMNAEERSTFIEAAIVRAIKLGLEQDQDEPTMYDYARRLIKLLDTKEESDGGHMFHPTYITSCRVMHVKELDTILDGMKELLSKPTVPETVPYEDT